MFVELMYCIFSGLADKDIGEALKDGQMQSLTSLKEGGGDSVGESLRDFLRAVKSYTRVIGVDASGGAPPAPNTRALQRYDSDVSQSGGDRKQEIEQERHECWKSAQQARRKGAGVGVLGTGGGPAGAGLQRLLGRSNVNDFGGKPKESHRAFVFSADLFTESAATPWHELSEVDAGQTAPFLQFMAEQKKPYDLLIACDGRSRKSRRVIEDALVNRAHSVEMWIVYSSAPKKVGGRCVSLAANNKEAITVCLPCPRTQLTVKDRECFNACGETTTHERTYSGVSMCSVLSMPKVSKEDKEAIPVSYTHLTLPTKRIV